jgi:hypothetical protein
VEVFCFAGAPAFICAPESISRHGIGIHDPPGSCWEASQGSEAGFSSAFVTSVLFASDGAAGMVRAAIALMTIANSNRTNRIFDSPRADDFRPTLWLIFDRICLLANFETSFTEAHGSQELCSTLSMPGTFQRGSR